MKILFVDDVRDTRDMFRLVFEMQHYETHLAGNGLEAVAAAQAQKFDAIVMDVEIPQMNGWDAVREIRRLENGAGVPIIMFTAYQDQADPEKAKEVGADLLLRKPIMPQAILAQINRLIEERAAQPAPATQSG